MAYYGIYIFKFDNLPDKETTSRHAESPPPTMSPTGHSSYRIAQALATWAIFVPIESAVSNSRSTSVALRWNESTITNTQGSDKFILHVWNVCNTDFKYLGLFLLINTYVKYNRSWKLRILKILFWLDYKKNNFWTIAWWVFLLQITPFNNSRK